MKIVKRPLGQHTEGAIIFYQYLALIATMMTWSLIGFVIYHFVTKYW